MRDKRTELLACLLAGMTLKGAAAKLEIGERTARRWAKEPEFQAELEAARKEAFGRALVGLHGVAGKAVRALTKALASEKAGDRIRAADVLLAAAFKGHDAADVQAKVRELEELVRVLLDERPRKTR